MRTTIFDEAKNLLETIRQSSWSYMDLDDAATELITHNDAYHAIFSADQERNRQALTQHFADEGMTPLMIECDLPDTATSHTALFSILSYAFIATYPPDPKTRSYSDLIFSCDEDEEPHMRLVAANPDAVDFDKILSKIDHLKTIAPTAWRSTQDNQAIYTDIPADKGAERALRMLLSKAVPSELAWVHTRTGKVIPLEKDNSSLMETDYIDYIAIQNMLLDDDLADHPAVVSQNDALHAKLQASGQQKRQKDAEYEARGYQKKRIFSKDAALNQLQEIGVNVRVTQR